MVIILKLIRCIGQKYDGEQTLLRVLRAYANFDRDIGYTQGMNVIAGALLIILHPETYKDQQSGNLLLMLMFYFNVKF